MVSYALKWIPYWAQNYGRSGAPDQRAAQDFMDCETVDAVQRLRAELYSVSRGNYDERILEAMIGANRKVVFQTYDEWARMMLLWMASYKVH